jgi:serine/threonine protein kinase
MSYCLNPRCTQPRNGLQTSKCESCGTSLLLRDRYRSTKVLGQGGFGTTFLATDEGLPGQPDCVIKQLRPAVDTPKFIAQCQKLFQREAETLGKIGNHPQITRLLDYFSLEQDFYLVQEYIGGSTLQQEICDAGPHHEAQARSVLQELLPVLDYLHGHKVIHRDIKPANIIRREIDDKLVLIDFGVVKDQVSQTLIDQASGQDAFTNFSVGTHGFAPPEQISRRPVYASDLYSLGMTCISLMLGRLPEDADYDPATGDFLWPNTIEISAPLKKVLTKLVESSVRDRYSSAQEVLADLEQARSTLAEQPQTVHAGVNVSQPPSEQMPVRPVTSPVAVKPSLAEALSVPQQPMHNSLSQIMASTAPAPTPRFKESGIATPKAKKDRPWWNRPLIGNRSMTERVIGLFIKLPISERALFLHQKALEEAEKLAHQGQTIDDEKFGSKEFTAFVRIQYALGKGDADYESLTRSAELLRIGVKAQTSYLQVEQIEVAYRGSKQILFYTFVQDLLAQQIEQEPFRQQIRANLETTLPQIKSKEGQAALRSYVDQLEKLAEHELGLRLLALFKEYQLADYSILRVVSELVNSLHRMELFDFKALVTQVVSEYNVFEKLGRIIGVPEHKSSPETYAKLLQYLALSEKYQTAYPKFQQLVALLEQWPPHRDTILAIRDQYGSPYKRPKTFQQTIPGIELYDKYKNYFEKD